MLEKTERKVTSAHPSDLGQEWHNTNRSLGSRSAETDGQESATNRPTAGLCQADSRKPPGNQCGPLVGLLAIIERYWATDFLQSFSYGGTARTPPHLRSSSPLGTLNVTGTGALSPLCCGSYQPACNMHYLAS
jgi:hypothetical protein